MARRPDKRLAAERWLATQPAILAVLPDVLEYSSTRAAWKLVADAVRDNGFYSQRTGTVDIPVMTIVAGARAVCDGSTAGAIASALVSRFEHLRAEVARLTQERDDWRLSFETSNAAMGALEARLTQERDEALTGNEEARTNRLWLESYTRGDQQRADSAEARLSAQSAALEELEQDCVRPDHVAMYRWVADRLAALRTSEVEK